MNDAGTGAPEEMQQFAIQALAVPNPKGEPIPLRMSSIRQGVPLSADCGVSMDAHAHSLRFPNPFAPVPDSRVWKAVPKTRRYASLDGSYEKYVRVSISVACA